MGFGDHLLFAKGLCVDLHGNQTAIVQTLVVPANRSLNNAATYRYANHACASFLHRAQVSITST
jgi:hypothetical protein